MEAQHHDPEERLAIMAEGTHVDERAASALRARLAAAATRGSLEDLQAIVAALAERESPDGNDAGARIDRIGRALCSRAMHPSVAAVRLLRIARESTPANDGRQSNDPLDALRGHGAIVGYDALIAATADPPVPIWHPGIEADSAIEISGPSGMGKTTLATLLVAARANPTATPVMLLGAPVTPGAEGSFAVLIEEENGRFSMRRKMEVACEALSLPLRETIDRMVFLVRQGISAGDARWQAVEALGRAGRVSCILIDSRARVLRGGESNSEDDQAAMANLLHRMIEQSNAPAIVVSHTRKGATEGIEAVAGSGQRGAGADVVLMVTGKKKSNGAIESSRLKFEKLRESTVADRHPDPITYALTKNAEGRWTLESDSVAPQDERPVVERVLDTIKAAREGITKTAIRAALKAAGRDVRTDIIEEAISLLFANRDIVAEQRMVSGKPRKVFLVREQAG